MGINTWVSMKFISKNKKLLEEFMDDINDIGAVIHCGETLDFDNEYEDGIMYDDDEEYYEYYFSGEMYNGYKFQDELECYFNQEKYKDNIEVYFGCISVDHIKMEKL